MPRSFARCLLPLALLHLGAAVPLSAQHPAEVLPAPQPRDSVRLEPAEQRGGSVVAAPQDTGRPHRLETVTVVATRGGEAGAVSATVRSGEALRRGAEGREMPFLLTSLPSVIAVSDAGSGTGYAYFRLRGMDQTRINVTLDGVPLNEPEDAGVYFSNYPDFARSLESVQVQRGVGTSSSGAAAYAGAINFEGPSLTGGHRGAEAAVTMGSFGTRHLALAGRTGLLPRGWAATGRVSALTSDGYRERSGNTSGSAFGTLGYLGARHLWKLTTFTGEARNDMAYLASSEAALAVNRRHNPLGADERDRFRQSFASLAHATDVGRVTVQTTSYVGRLRGDYDVRVGDDLLNFNLGSTWLGALSTARWSRGAVAFDAGAHASAYRREHWLALRPDRSTALYRNAGRKADASAFLRATATVGRLTATADVQERVARFRYEPDPESAVSPAAVQWAFLSPKVALQVDGGTLGRWSMSLARTAREPTRNDMFAGFDNLDTSNVAFVGPFTRVRPERVVDVEVGVARTVQGADIRLTAFRMAFRDEIAPIGQLSYIGLPLRKNVERSRREGVELEAALPTGRVVEGTLTATLMRGRIAAYTDDASGVTYRDVEPLLTPRATAAHDLRLRLPLAATLLVNGRYASRSYLANTGDARFVLPASYLLDVGVARPIGATRVELVVGNVANGRRYASGYTDGTDAYYFVQAPRHVTLAVTYRR